MIRVKITRYEYYVSIKRYARTREEYKAQRGLVLKFLFFFFFNDLYSALNVEFT